MRTIRTKVYQFSELSEQAKQVAFNNYVNDVDFFEADNYIKSLEGFAKHFNCTIPDYSIDWNKYESYRNKIVFNTENAFEDIGVFIASMGEYNKETLRGDGDCVFTGYCADEDAADGARAAFLSGETDINKILMAGYESWYKAAVNDYEGQLTMEYYEDFASANEYEFKADGTRF